MDLKDVVNHRDDCIICGKPMKLSAWEYPNLEVSVHENGMRIRSGHNKGVMMLFGFEGKYQRNQRNYKVYNAPVEMIKQCEQCSSKNPPEEVVVTTGMGQQFVGTSSGAGKPIILKSRSAGMTTMTAALANFTNLNNMKSKECWYKFNVWGDAEGNYSCTLKYETVRYFNDDAFWHVDTNYLMDSTTLTHSRFDATINDVMNSTIRIPSTVNLGSVKTLEKFLEKYKMYMLMS